MKSIRALVIGCAVGLVALVPSCGSSRRACDEASCGGCCDENDRCVPGGADQACGSGGGRCIACPATHVCRSGTCVDRRSACQQSCSGCCDGATCRPGNELTACGSGGVACATCGSNQVCEGQCKDPACTGCISGVGLCEPGTKDLLCGKGGSACIRCADGRRCEVGTCVPVFMGIGCTSADGGCLQGESAAACGRPRRYEKPPGGT